MCHDCPTPRDRVRAVVHELAADLLLPFVLIGLVLGLLLVTGTVGWGELGAQQ